MPISKDSILNSITILGSLPPLRALSSYCLEFSLAISRLVEIEFISFRYIYPTFLYPGGSLKEDYTFPRIKQSNIKERRYLSWYNPLSWIIEGISTKGQLLHAQWWSPPLVLIYITICFIYKIRKRPVVITVHNIIEHEQRFFYDFLSSILFRLCDHFIVHSRSNRERLIKYYKIDREKVTPVHHGPLNFQNRTDIDRYEARRELGLGLQDRVILLFGAIRPYKGVDIALKAFAEVINEIPDARLVVAGRLWEAWDRYEEIIRDQNINTYVKKYLKYIDSNEVAKYFIASDLVILPYIHFESQSGVGTTAVAFRKPMIVSRTGGLPDLVVDQANVVPPDDKKALANRIIYCLKDHSAMAKMSAEADIIAEKISWHQVAAKTLSIYKKMILDKIST